MISQKLNPSRVVNDAVLTDAIGKGSAILGYVERNLRILVRHLLENVVQTFRHYFPPHLGRPYTGGNGGTTEEHLGVRASFHDLRGCVATEAVEADPAHGPARASALLRHRDPRVTRAYYDHADGLVAVRKWEAFLAANAPERPALAIAIDASEDWDESTPSAGVF